MKTSMQSSFAGVYETEGKNIKELWGIADLRPPSLRLCQEDHVVMGT